MWGWEGKKGYSMLKGAEAWTGLRSKQEHEVGTSEGGLWLHHEAVEAELGHKIKLDCITGEKHHSTFNWLLFNLKP